MDASYSRKLNHHMEHYKLPAQNIHPVIFGENLSINFTSFQYLKKVCNNVNAVLTRVGHTIIKSQLTKSDIYYELVEAKRSEWVDTNHDKIESLNPRLINIHGLGLDV